MKFDTSSLPPTGLAPVEANVEVGLHPPPLNVLHHRHKAGGIASAILALALCAHAIHAEPAWRWQKTTVPAALVVEGLWADGFRVGEALDRAGIRRGWGMDDLSRYTLVVLVNAPVSLLPGDSAARLRTFVEQGGGLVVLGGLSAFNNGGYIGSPLDAMLPVVLDKSSIWHSHRPPPWVPLTRDAQADWPCAFDFAGAPTAQYFHHLEPRAGARAQVRVGDLPAVVSGSFGAGRVVACALTVNGDPSAGILPFWDWPDWPALLAQAITWAGAARPAGEPAPVCAATDVKPLTETEIQSAILGLDKLPNGFVRRAVAYPDARAADLLFDLAVPGDGGPDPFELAPEPRSDTPSVELSSVLPALLPFARADWAPRLLRLADPMHPDLESRRAALILLGAGRAPSAYAALTAALRQPATELAAMDGLGRHGNPAALPLLRRRFEDALAPARLPDGPDRWKPAEFAAAARPAAYAAVALYRLGDPEGVARLVTLAGHARFILRVYQNATKRGANTPQGRQALKVMHDEMAMLSGVWDYLNANVAPVPALQADAFAAYAAEAGDAVLVEFLASAIERSTRALPDAAWRTLAGARSGVISRMARGVE